MNENEDIVGFVADIGGTNARFALLARDARPALLAEERLACADYPALEAAVRAYLDRAGLRRAPPSAVLAVAGPVRGDRFRMTNAPWSFSAAELQAHFGFKRLDLVNDFTAVAHALPHLETGDLVRIGDGATAMAPAAGTLAVLGPGTGLGVGGLIRDGGMSLALKSEGGHAGFAPVDGLDEQILHRLRCRFGRVSCERLLSGPGLVNLAAAMAEIEGLTHIPATPAEIVTTALADGESFDARVLRRFCAILGGFAGDLALLLGAWAGVFVAGGMVPRFTDIMVRSEFRRRFEAKGRFESLLRTVPTHVVVHRDPGLLGAAAILLSKEVHRA